MSAETLQTLNITAIILASLSGLFGVYFVLFVLAIWSTYRQDVMSSKRLRWVTIALFLDLLAHFITRSLEFSRARLQNDSDKELLKWSIPLTVVGNVTTTIAGLLSDGTLAWRFYIIFGKTKWALYFPAVGTLLNALLCWSADFQHLAAYSNREFYENRLLPVTLDITVAWGFFMFSFNSLLTGGILYKIIWANRALQGIRTGGGWVSQKYRTALRALVEAAVVTWIGILICEIALLAPTGHVTTNPNIGYIVVAIIPIFFGISQSLITARLGLVRETGSTEATVYASQESSNRRANTLNVYTVTETSRDADSQTMMDFEVKV
ncbi:hypothetical protein BJV78DRAFT_4372 [Lactifluus subvellereus]|nr:hypothetical protein BJV78DRAFT_4372 [Lactifluus subvellereus]